MEVYITGTNQRILVHNKKDCEGGYCCIHNPSNHHMKDWPTNWRNDRKLMERIDIFGVGHPDPDDLSYKETIGLDIETESIHGCNGLCIEKNYKQLLKENEKCQKH